MTKIRLPKGAEKDLKIGSIIGTAIASNSLFRVTKFEGTDTHRTWKVQAKKLRGLFDLKELAEVNFSILGESIIEKGKISKTKYIAKI